MTKKSKTDKARASWLQFFNVSATRALDILGNLEGLNEEERDARGTEICEYVLNKYPNLKGDKASVMHVATQITLNQIYFAVAKKKNEEAEVEGKALLPSLGKTGKLSPIFEEIFDAYEKRGWIV